MPLARIDLPAGKPADYVRAVADVVYEAMIATLNAPKDDRFQVICEHAPENSAHRSDLPRHQVKRGGDDRPADAQRRPNS